MQNIFELRRKLLLEVDFDTLTRACQTDKLAQQICNGADFWRDRYIVDNIEPPQVISDSYEANIIYIRALKILESIDEENSVLTETIEFDIPGVYYSEDNHDIRDIITEIDPNTYAGNVILSYYERIYYISDGTVFEYGNKITSKDVDKEQLLKFIQFLLVLEIKMWFIKNTGYSIRPDAEYLFSKAATFSYLT